MPGRKIRFGLIAAALILFAPTVGWAQEKARLPNEDGGLMQWVIAAALIAIVCAPAAINPKRTHQD